MNGPFSVSHSLFPFESHWSLVDDIPIHYIDEGKGPVLLLIHGNFMWSFSFRKLIAALSDSFRVVSIDLAGMGMSGKPHALGLNEFEYSYREQSHIVESVVKNVGLTDISFLSFDHGGAIGFGVMTRCPERFSRIVIANSWAWSCHNYRATKIWSTFAPLSNRVLKALMLNKKRWIFESWKERSNPEVWDACVNPYLTAADFAPISALAAQLTRARPYFEEIENNLHLLQEKEIEVVWTTKSGGLFPEFVEEDLFLGRWREIFPNAPVKRVSDIGYYDLVTHPSGVLLDAIVRR